MWTVRLFSTRTDEHKNFYPPTVREFGFKREALTFIEAQLRGKKNTIMKHNRTYSIYI